MAMLLTTDDALSLKEIYSSVESNYAYYRHQQDATSWQESVRHAVRLSKVFQKAGKSAAGRQTWQVNPLHRGEIAKKLY